MHDLPEAGFAAVCGKLAEAGVEVNCFGSAVANWGRSVDDPFEETLEEMVARCIPRMQRLGTKLVRVMSYVVMLDRAPDDQAQDERFRRLREIVARFSGAGLTAVHENCANYGGMGWSFTLRLLENVPGLKLVFDTGNPVGTHDYAGPDPSAPQSTWEFYQHVKEHITYVHIKDGRFRQWKPGSIWSNVAYTWPGEGEGDVARVVTDLLHRGYDGGFSMEPHLAVVFHDASQHSEEEARYRNYVEYGRRFEEIVAVPSAG